jgi:hypothetical protein
MEKANSTKEILSDLTGAPTCEYKTSLENIWEIIDNA